MSYPVNWSRFKVLRDFVQNFYDSIGFEQWTKRFSCKQTRDSIIMRAENVVFDYQWLVHIGASTKREQPGKYAGKFGEGFKIASLVGYRDYNWNITMSSGDWRIYITSSDFSIDGQTMKSLAYLIEKVPHVNCSELIISGGVPIHEDTLKSVMANLEPITGKKINKYGLQIRYSLRSIALKRSLFFRENYGQAWSTYIHELTHVFGGDQSAGFSRALSLTMDICMHEIDSLSSLRAMWQQSFDKLRKTTPDQTEKESSSMKNPRHC
ncbi:MAG: hypothetical protein GQF41_0516 [Candidatus Rifleibacterium amylolyticum]|nr:MAG: hypothetical protein GQF41_0516 [Candidatus Rifleibacterium amylolyticum]